MKKLNILLLNILMSVCLLASCGNGDDANNGIEGTWKHSNSSVEITGGSDAVKSQIRKAMESTPTGSTVTFTNDGKVSGSFLGGIVAIKNGTYTFQNGRLTTIFNDGADVTTTDCKLDGNTLTMRYDMTGKISFEGVTKLILITKYTRQ
jgi:hypothetical protein